MPETQELPNWVDLIMGYEDGELTDTETVNLFSQLIKNGQAWSLQGHYGRTAERLIDLGIISRNGEVDHGRLEEVLDNN